MKKQWSLLLSLLLLGLSGCAAVQPWQKKNLGSVLMQFRPEQGGMDYQEHIQITLEQAQGGYAGTGGNCGCR